MAAGSDLVSVCLTRARGTRQEVSLFSDFLDGGKAVQSSAWERAV